MATCRIRRFVNLFICPLSCFSFCCATPAPPRGPARGRGFFRFRPRKRNEFLARALAKKRKQKQKTKKKTTKNTTHICRASVDTNRSFCRSGALPPVQTYERARCARRPDGITAWAVGLSHSGDLISHGFLLLLRPSSSLPSSH